MHTHRNMSTADKTARISLAAFALALIAGVAITAKDAQAQNSCKWYGSTSLQQQQLNVKKKCGFTKPTWHSDLGAHIEWCEGVAPAEWKAVVKQRSKMLNGCKK